MNNEKQANITNISLFIKHKILKINSPNVENNIINLKKIY